MEARRREERAEPLEEHGCAGGEGGLTTIVGLRELRLGSLRTLWTLESWRVLGQAVLVSETVDPLGDSGLLPNSFYLGVRKIHPISLPARLSACLPSLVAASLCT